MKRPRYIKDKLCVFLFFVFLITLGVLQVLSTKGFIHNITK